MSLLVYMLVNVNGIYYVHVCEQALWSRSPGNSAIENLCIIIIYFEKSGHRCSHYWSSHACVFIVSARTDFGVTHAWQLTSPGFEAQWGVELRGCAEAEVALLGSRALILSLVVSVDVKQCWTKGLRAQELVKSRGVCPGLPVPNKPDNILRT